MRTFRATVAPDNAPRATWSLAHGFVGAAEQWDDEDGLEIVYEVAV